MANGEEKSNDDLYAVLGLEKECTASELRNAYKKLALRWHPDRCSASGNSKFVEEAKQKFQAIQQAYSVLSDSNKRFLYDVGVYDSNDADENGMGDFLNEMAVMMSQTKSNEKGEETFEELQDLFEDLFQGNDDTFGSSSQTTTSETSSSNNKRNSSEMNLGISDLEGNLNFQNFCIGVEQQEDAMKGKGVREVPGEAGDRRRHGRKQKVSSCHDVSSTNYSGISV